MSDAFILRSVAGYLQQPVSETSLIVLHLGSGASVCAIRDGKSINVSMGLTPLSGLPGGTRSGDVDPSLIFHYTVDNQDVGRMSHDRTRSMHITEVSALPLSSLCIAHNGWTLQAEKILNTEAGWKSLTGTTDFHEIAISKMPSHKLAFDIFVDRVCQFVGM